MKTESAYELFIAPYRFTRYQDVKANLSHSDYGYWITPDGDVYSLDIAMSHGRVAAGVYPILYNKTLQASDEGIISSTDMDIAVVSTYGWMRVSSHYSLTVNWSHSRPVTRKQLEALSVILDTHDPEDEGEIWFDGGPGNFAELKKQIKKSVGIEKIV